ncbi:MAG: AAA family ATPase [Gemmatimonadaceae bacterium]
MALLWSDSGDTRARNAFRQTLHRLKSIAGQPLLSDSRDTVSLSSEVEVDTNLFQAAIKSGRWTDAIALYGGEFLQGLVAGEQGFDEWADGERRRLGAAYVGVLERAAAQAAESGDSAAALDYARRIITIDPLNAAACAREVRILIGAGRRDEAVLLAELHADVLSREVGEAAAEPLRQLAVRTRASATPSAQRAERRDTRGPPQFIGRNAELAQLLALWRSTEEEQGGLALITGPGGIGKSRLLAEFTQRARPLGTMRVASGKERGEWDIPYAGIADALRVLVRAPAAAGASKHLLVEAARLLPELRDRFDLPDPAPLRDDAELLRFFEGVSAFIEAVAYDEPLYIQVDDFQRASARSTQLAAYLADRLSGAPVVFAYALRIGEPGEELPTHVTAFMQRAASRAAGAAGETIIIHVPPLSDEELAELGRAVIGGPDESRRSLLEAAAGSPGKLLALSRGELPRSGIALVPLRTILRERLAQATQHERRVFVAASFYGRATPLRLVAAAAHLSEPAAYEAALALEEADLLVQDGPGIAPAHPDSLELAVEGSGPAGSALLAGWAADALAAEPDAEAADLARLYVLSGRGDDAAPHVRVAAMLAAVNGSTDAAVSLLQRALALPMEETSRQQLERLLRALGVGPLLIGGGGPSGPTTPPASARDPDTSAQPLAPVRERAWAYVSELPRRFPWATTATAILLILAATIRVQGALGGRAGAGAFLSDTLLVTEGAGGRGSLVVPVTGQLLPAPRIGPPRPPDVLDEWLRSIAPPWVNPRPSPDGRFAAVERVTSTGASVFLLTRDGRDTIPIANAPGEWLGLGWSPDGSWILALRAFRDLAALDVAHLYAIEAKRGGRVVTVDTGANRLVTEAAWSPTGDRIGWTARNRSTRQQDIYVAGFGEAPVNVSRGAAEDYGITWSPDGTAVAFTSERDRRPQIYSVRIEPEQRLIRVTHSDASDMNPAFSPDGRQLAFESTRGGQLGVWLTTAVGGAAQRITPRDRAFALFGWTARPRRFIHSVEVSGPRMVSVGDTFVVSAQAIDQFGIPFSDRLLTWDVPSTRGARIQDLDEDQYPNRIRLVARELGAVAITARVAEWRARQLSVTITQPPVTGLSDDFDGVPLRARWQLLGRSTPVVVRGGGRNGTAGLAPMGSRPWASGVLSRDVLLLKPGLSLRAAVRAPFADVGDARSFTLALVDDDPTLPSDSLAPQPFKVVHITWAGDGDRLIYGAGREATSEPTDASGSGPNRDLLITVERDGRVAFLVDGKLRWRSTARLVETAGPHRRVRVWLGGINTGSVVTFDDVSAESPER